MSLKMRSFFVFVIVFTLICTTNIFGADSKTSSWAEEEVNDAIVNHLVHESLRSNYQTPIKRYEYVLLALDVLSLEGVRLSIGQEYAFDDILDHPYEKEILKAYQAGLINGYGNGQFMPDANITREEVATLVVRLLSKINDTKDNTNTNAITYSDSNSISSWARESVDYCYRNNILKGVGKDKQGRDIINPKGTATREESILLLYRLAKAEQVIASSTVNVVTIDPNLLELPAEQEEGTIVDLTYLTKNFSEETANIIMDLDESEKVAIVDVSKNGVLIVVNNTATIYMFKNDEGIGLELYSNKTIGNDEKTIYLDLLKSLNENQIISDSVDEGINALNLHQSITDETIANRYFIYIRIDETNHYLVKYYEQLF